MALHQPYMTNKGYVMEYHPEHPRANKRGYVFAHIVAYEKHTGSGIPDDCVVHHINGVKTDNAPQNLVLMTRKDHTIFHHTGQKRSEETKEKISKWAKERLRVPSNHPMFLPLDIEAIKLDHALGMSVKQICKKYGISRYTYYSRITGYRRKK
jgi:predicted DNA-binding protein (UPF0251 family)